MDRFLDCTIVDIRDIRLFRGGEKTGYRAKLGRKVAISGKAMMMPAASNWIRTNGRVCLITSR